MTRQAINVGSGANDGTGDKLRAAYQKINANEEELYGRVGLLEMGAIAFATAIPFSGSYVMAEHAIAGAIIFTVDTTDRRIGGECVVTLIANGTNIPTFTGMYEMSGSTPYVNTLNQVNQVYFFYDGRRTWYSISTAIGGLTGDVTVPVLSAAAVESGQASQIKLTYDSELDTGSVPATGDFVVSGSKTITGVGVSGSVVTITVNSPYVYTDSITISYTPGTNRIQDIVGNDAAALSSQAVQNSIGNLTATAVTFSSLIDLDDEGGEVYAAQADAAPNGAQGLMTEVSASGAQAWIECQKPATGDASTVLALDPVGTAQAYSLNDYIAQVNTSGLVSYGQNAINLTSTGYTLPEGSGSRLRLHRSAANAITVQTTTDNGANWTVRYTFPGTASSTLRGHFYTAFLSTPRRIYQPRKAGMT